MSLIGDLNDIKLADVLRLFHSGKKTGRLTVSAEQDQTVLRLQAGALVFARGAGGRLAGEDAVLDLFGWSSGQMTFVPDERPVAPNVGRSLDELIEEGLRRGEALHRSNRLISSDRVVFQFAAGPARGQVCAVGSTEWRVLRLVDGVRDVGELVAGTGLPRAEVVRVLVELVEGGLVERIEPQRDLRVRSHGLFGGKGTASLDQRVEEDWRKLQRFGRGVLRVEVRSAAGRGAVLPVQFRASLGREVHLSREIIGELRVSEGDEVHVRPVG